MSPSAAVRVAGLQKRFGARTALAGIDLEVPEGEFVTLFGPNGAGKTTLIRCLSTLARPTSGQVWIHGTPLQHSMEGIRRHLGVVSHTSFLYGALSARENLEFYARMFGVQDPQQHARRALEQVGLGLRADDPVRDFSRGLLQRCAIARALVHGPDILLFDEPFSGLDPLAADTLQRILEQARAQGHTVLMTSHDLSRGRELADRLVILHRGRVVYCEPAGASDSEQLKRQYRQLIRTEQP